eukprot:1156085-Pelagomonas_calceolata.AAC.8
MMLVTELYCHRVLHALLESACVLHGHNMLLYEVYMEVEGMRGGRSLEEFAPGIVGIRDQGYRFKTSHQSENARQ